MLAGPLLSGCGLQYSPRHGLAERCADVMRRAYPSGGGGGRYDRDHQDEATATTLDHYYARSKDRGPTMPDGPLPAVWPVECRFDENVLTGSVGRRDRRVDPWSAEGLRPPSSRRHNSRGAAPPSAIDVRREKEADAMELRPVRRKPTET